MLGMHVVNDCLLVPLGAAPDEEAVRQLQSEVLAQTHETSVKGVFIDVSAVTLLDSSTFSLLLGLVRTVTFMGVPSIFVGFQAGVAGALIDLNVDTSGIFTAITMEDAFEMLNSPDFMAEREGKNQSIPIHNYFDDSDE